MKCYFIYNNLKVSPFLPEDAPLPGFEVLTWDNESYTEYGSLWDLGKDAGFSIFGDTKVHGQIWLANERTDIGALEQMFSVPNLTVPQEVEVVIKTIDGEINEKVTAITFKLNTVKNIYTRVHDGNWLIKRG